MTIYITRFILFLTGLFTTNVIANNEESRSLSLYNQHTGEYYQGEYWSNGEYIEASLIKVNNFLRDFRLNKIKKIDTKLLDILYQIQQALGPEHTIHVISGYRSPVTNSMLRNQGRRVAKNSFHMKGRAIDITVPSVSVSTLKKVAQKYRIGGLGYYPGNHFIHLDTGSIRNWNG